MSKLITCLTFIVISIGHAMGEETSLVAWRDVLVNLHTRITSVVSPKATTQE